MKNIQEFARELRQTQTDAENLIWCFLRNRRLIDVKFRRQHPCPPYVLDFYSYELKLAIELDGGQHNLERERKKDLHRSVMLKRKGIDVIRFWDNQVLSETEAVLEAIYNEIMKRKKPLTPTL